MVAATILGLAVALTGCSGTSTDHGMDGVHGGSGTSSSTPMMTEAALPDGTNEQDVMFLRMMIPHHEQAVRMSESLLEKNDVPTAVAELAGRIADEQSTEITMMTGLLSELGRSSSSTGTGMSGMDSTGMMSGSEMDALDAAEGTEAARLFLDGMIPHHESAVTMAENEMDAGLDEAVVDFATSIVSSQTAEIDEMKALLAGL